MAEGLEDAVSLVGSRVAMVAAPGVDNLFLAHVRKLVHSDDPFGLLVGALTDAGLANVPSLACAVTERGGVRLIVRGSGKALVKTADGRSEIVSAKRVSTWSEHAFSQVEEVVLVAPNTHGDQTSLVLFLDSASQAKRAPRRTKATVTEASPPGEALPSSEWAPPPSGEPAAPLPPPMAPAAALPRFDTVPPSAPVDDDPELDFDHLIGDTRYRGVEAAAVRPPVEQPPDRDEVDDITTFHPLHPPSGFDDGDHDGNTVSLSDLRDLTANHTVVPSPPLDTVVPSAPPLLGRLRFDDGQVVDVDRPIVLGRQPRFQTPHPDPRSTPRLVTLADPEQALSRSHAEVRIDGWQILVVDLGSTNGTRVLAPGLPPQDLIAEVPVPLAPGTRVELAGEIGFTFEAVGDQR